MELPNIKEGDLVLLSVKEVKEIEEVKHNFLFHSDGRIAQTDLSISDPGQELAKVYPSRGLIDNESIAIERLINEAVENGLLKEYVNVFGRDKNRDRIYGGGIEWYIVWARSPITIFGYKNDLLELGVEKLKEFKFADKNYGLHIPRPSLRRGRDYITWSNENITSISVGSSAIREKMAGSELECYINQDPIISYLGDIIR